MSNTSLHNWRFVVPGLLTVFAAFSLLVPGLNFLTAFKNVDIKETAPLGLFVVVMASIYRFSDARERFSINFSWSEIHGDIREALLDGIGERRVLSEPEKQFLRADRRLMDIFYSLIDGDSSLKTRAEGIRFNGLLVTSVADFGIIAILASALHFVAAVLHSRVADAYWYFGCCMAWVLSENILLPIALSNHRRLTGEQVSFIANNLANELTIKAEGALQRMRSTPIAAELGRTRTREP